MLTASSPSGMVGQAVTFSATISTGSTLIPSGSIELYDNGDLLAAFVLGQDVPTYTTSDLASGTHVITATYNGDQNFDACSMTINYFVI